MLSSQVGWIIVMVLSLVNNKTSSNYPKCSSKATDQNQKIRSYHTNFKISTLVTSDFKVIFLVFKPLNGQGPLYIAEMLETYSHVETYRSAGKLQQSLVSTRTKQEEAAFSCYAVCLWNRLPVDIKTSPTISIFKPR